MLGLALPLLREEIPPSVQELEEQLHLAQLGMELVVSSGCLGRLAIELESASRCDCHQDLV